MDVDVGKACQQLSWMVTVIFRFLQLNLVRFLPHKGVNVTVEHPGKAGDQFTPEHKDRNGEKRGGLLGAVMCETDVNTNRRNG